MFQFRPALLAAVGATALLSGCVTPTPYQPATGTGYYANGYSDERLDGTHFSVRFSGNSYTERATVERYLLYRAAELTVQSGNDYFILIDRATDKHTQTYVDRPFNSGPYGFWGPSWRYYGHGYGWRSWDPFGGDPFWDHQIDVRTVEKYEATAEVAVGRGPVPNNNVRAFDARNVLSTIGPSIVMPK